MLVKRNKMDLHEQALYEHAVAENDKLRAQIEYLAIMGGYDELLKDETTEEVEA